MVLAGARMLGVVLLLLSWGDVCDGLGLDFDWLFWGFQQAALLELVRLSIRWTLGLAVQLECVLDGGVGLVCWRVAARRNDGIVQGWLEGRIGEPQIDNSQRYAVHTVRGVTLSLFVWDVVVFEALGLSCWSLVVLREDATDGLVELLGDFECDSVGCLLDDRDDESWRKGVSHAGDQHDVFGASRCLGWCWACGWHGCWLQSCRRAVVAHWWWSVWIATDANGSDGSATCECNNDLLDERDIDLDGLQPTTWVGDDRDSRACTASLWVSLCVECDCHVLRKIEECELHLFS
mmetsp:Transcript_10858/g.29982  ORF Transcript_10858/g.29982 Transcript_10858/m.29982 type:complete len:292 (-) Transcript_10858:404-1279(-)